jgi:hypothetical protein
MEKIGQQGDHQAAGGIKKCAGKTCPKVGDVWYQMICNDLQKACVVNDFRCPNKYVRTLGIVTCPKIWHVRLFLDTGQRGQAIPQPRTPHCDFPL